MAELTSQLTTLEKEKVSTAKEIKEMKEEMKHSQDELGRLFKLLEMSEEEKHAKDKEISKLHESVLCIPCLFSTK